MRIHTLDSKVFKECEFLKILEEINLSTFLYSPSRKVYPSLVNMFFSNLYFTGGIIYSEIRRHNISLSLQYFARILDLPTQGHILKLEEQGDNFNFKSVVSLFLKNSTSLILNPFIVGFIFPNISMIHYMINHIIFPSKRKFCLLTRFYVETIRMIANKIEIN